MRTSINTVKFVTLLSIVFLLLTYSISLNEENKWILLDTPWLSNRIVFAIVGGSFTSLVVIVACELQKYFLMKHQMEDYIFGQLFTLYSQIAIIHYNTKCQLNEPNAPVPYNLFEEIVNRGILCLNSLNTIDFVSFKTQNVIRAILNRFNRKNGLYIRSFLQNTVFLKIAVNEDKIAKLSQGRNEIITASSPKTRLALKKIFDDSCVILSYLEILLGQIDNKFEYRYHWREVKRNIILSEDNFVPVDLNDYLKSPTINFE